MSNKINGAVEIRWHGRGGQGAKTACLMLADIAFKASMFRVSLNMVRKGRVHLLPHITELQTSLVRYIQIYTHRTMLLLLMKPC